MGPRSLAAVHERSYIRLESALYVKTLDFISQVISFQLGKWQMEECFRNIVEAKCKINLMNQDMLEERKLSKDYWKDGVPKWQSLG